MSFQRLYPTFTHSPVSAGLTLQKAAALDLSFPRFDRSAELVVWPGDLAVLMVGVAARQRGSATAQWQARLDAGPFAPVDGAFNRGMAAAIVRWREE